MQSMLLAWLGFVYYHETLILTDSGTTSPQKFSFRHCPPLPIAGIPEGKHLFQVVPYFEVLTKFMEPEVNLVQIQ